MQVAREHGLSGLADVSRSTPQPRVRHVRHGQLFGIRTGQVVGTQLAAVLVVAGLAHGRLALGSAVFGAVTLLALLWARLRGRWAYEWLGVALHFSGRPAGGVPTVLDLAAPGARVTRAKLAGSQAGVISDGHGLAAVFDLGEAAGVLDGENGEGDGNGGLPTPARLLTLSRTGLPPFTCQVVLTGVPALAAGTGLAAASYDQLTGGALLGCGRALLAVRVARPEGATDNELLPALARVTRAMSRGPTPARLLDAPEARAVFLADRGPAAAGPRPGVQESWSGLRVDGTSQATFRLERWPGPPDRNFRHFIARLLALPAETTTVALSAGPAAGPGGPTAADLHVRLAAADQAGLTHAVEALHRLGAAHGMPLRRLDGEHRAGLAATLPLAAPPGPQAPGRRRPRTTPAEVLAALGELTLPLPRAGLMIGRNRHGEPVTARLFRSRPTRVLLIGSPYGAQLVVMRATALGARVIVRTDRPRVWEPLAGVLGGAVQLATVPRAARAVRAAPSAEPREGLAPGPAAKDVNQRIKEADPAVVAALSLAAASRPGWEADSRDGVSTNRPGWASAPPGDAAAGGPGREPVPVGPGAQSAADGSGSAGGTFRPMSGPGLVGAGGAPPGPGPVLVVVDAGPARLDDHPVAGGQAVLVVRDSYGPRDGGEADRADLLLVLPLGAEAAAATGAALELGEAAGWLARMRPGMVALVNRRAVRWAAFSPTALETQVLGGAGAAQRDAAAGRGREVGRAHG